MTTAEPRNPLYLLLLLASLLFVVTALAYAVVPGSNRRPPMPGSRRRPRSSATPCASDGWRWLLYEVGAVVVLSVASMAVDRLRTLQKQRADVTIPPANEEKPSP